MNFVLGLGKAWIEPSSPVEASSAGTWKIIYEAGEKGIKKGGKVSFGIPHGFSVPQVDNPYHPGFCTAKTTNPQVSLILRCTRSTSNRLDWKGGRFGRISTGVLVHICESSLKPGDRVIFTYGDKSFGSPGAFARSIEGPAEFTILVCPEDSWSEESHFYFVPSPILKVIAREPKKSVLIFPSIIKSEEEVKGKSLKLNYYDEFYNLSQQEEIKNFSLERKDNILEIKVEGKKFKKNPTLLDTQPSFRLFWGDLHVHTFLSDGLREPEEALEYAKEVNRDDFCAITDHSFLTDEGWEKLCEANRKYNKDGEFVTFPAYEFAIGSIHRNVYFLREEILIRAEGEEKIAMEYLKGFDSSDEKTRYPSVESVRELFSLLNPWNSMVIPHIHLMDWENHNPKLERLVEIYSCWGNREFSGCKYSAVDEHRVKDTVQYALSQGLKLGFVGGSDGHGGRPGKDFWLRVRGARMGGITGIYAKELTRESLWESLKARRCYATTGERIIIKFTLNGHMMGEEVKVEKERIFTVEVYGTEKISKVEIIKNNLSVYQDFPKEEQCKFTWEDRTPPQEGDYYYIRVEQEDGNMAWSSPIWIREGGEE